MPVQVRTWMVKILGGKHQRSNSPPKYEPGGRNSLQAKISGVKTNPSTGWEVQVLGMGEAECYERVLVERAEQQGSTGRKSGSTRGSQHQ